MDLYRFGGNGRREGRRRGGTRGGDKNSLLGSRVALFGQMGRSGSNFGATRPPRYHAKAEKQTNPMVQWGGALGGEGDTAARDKFKFAAQQRKNSVAPTKRYADL